MSYQKVLTSLAILKVNHDRLGRGYLDNFVPFVAECIRLSPEDEVKVPVLANDLRTHFGLVLPHHVLQEILKRAVKEGYVQRKEQSFVANRSALNELKFSRTRQEILKAHTELVDSFIRYCETKTGRRWTEDEAEHLLLSYISTYGIDLLHHQDSPVIDLPKREGGADFRIVGSFVRYVREKQRHELDYIVSLTQGMMLASSIYFNPSQIQSRFKNTYFYFDTTFLIIALGYAGDERRIPCIELLNLLYEKGANLACFTHTQEEMQDILEAIARSLRSGSPLDVTAAHTGIRREVMDYFIQKQYSPSDIMLCCQRVPDSLAALRITVKDRPSSTAAPEYAIDEQALINALKQISYYNERALLRDVESISGIALIRHGHKPQDIETCRAALVTTNARLVEIATEFFSTHLSYTHKHIPPCLLDTTLTTLVWLKSPLKAPDLPQKRVIADAYAALQPPDYAWRLYLQEVEKLRQRGDVTEQDVFLLRYTSEVQEILTDRIIAGKPVNNEQAVYETLGQVKARLTHEQRQRIYDLEQKLQKKEHELGSRDAILKAQLDKIKIISNLIGKICSIISTLPIIMLILLSSFSLSLNYIYQFLLSIVGAMSTIYGWSVIGLKRLISLWISEKIYKFILKYFGIETLCSEANRNGRA